MGVYYTLNIIRNPNYIVLVIVSAPMLNPSSLTPTLQLEGLAACTPSACDLLMFRVRWVLVKESMVTSLNPLEEPSLRFTKGCLGFAEALWD